MGDSNEALYGILRSNGDDNEKNERIFGRIDGQTDRRLSCGWTRRNRKKEKIAEVTMHKVVRRLTTTAKNLTDFLRITIYSA